jgi:hypothetical protein
MKTKNNLASPTIIAVAVAVSILVAFSATASAAVINVPADQPTIEAAVSVANSGDTINVAAGTYNEGIIGIDKDLDIVGATTPSKPTINPIMDTGTANDIGSGGRGWFQIHNSATVTFENLVFDGTGKNIYTAVHYHGNSAGGTVENCDFMNIRYSLYLGRGINNYGQHVEVLDCTFTNIERIGVFTFNPSASTLIKDCTYAGKGTGDGLDYGIEFGGGGSGTVDGCDISACTGVAESDGSTSAGILATTYYAAGTSATVVNSILTGNSDGIAVGYSDTDATELTAHCNDISGNIEYGISNVGTVEVDAENNWWGDCSGPTHLTNPSGTGDKVSDNVDFDPWSFTPDPCEAKTIGFWKTHGDSVDAVLVLVEDGQIDLGGFTVEDSGAATAVFNKAKNKNANTMLAAQLLAAKLNVAHLEHLHIDYCECIDGVIDAADGILIDNGYEGPDTPGIAPRGEAKDDVNEIKDDLDEYNQDECPC